MRTAYFNGILAKSGKYSYPPRDMRELAREIAAKPLLKRQSPARHLRGEFVRRFAQMVIEDSGEIGSEDLQKPFDGAEKNDISAVGWGILFPEEEKGPLLQQLAPLLSLRQQQAGAKYCEIPYQNSHHLNRLLGESGGESYGAGGYNLPQYMLIVGQPTQIPFFVQFELDRYFMVGRLGFDQIEDYGRYARNLVSHEGKTKSSLKATLFATAHPNETTSTYSAKYLGRFLEQRIRNSFPAERYKVDLRIGDQANKKTLDKIMGGPLTPDLLLTATHGVTLEPSEPDRFFRLGSLICDDFPGPNNWNNKPIPPGMLYAGSDVKNDAQFDGMIAFIHACFGGGAPEYSSFPLEPDRRPARESNEPFIANLPKRMMAVEKGCRAIVAHVDTAFIWSFTDEKLQDQTKVFQLFFRSLLEGNTIGLAMNVFQQAYLEKLAQYKDLVEAHNDDRLKWEDDRLVQAWMAVNDLQNYILLGDPAVSLPKLSN